MDSNKPLNLVIYEFQQEISQLIRNSKLPGYILEPIFKEIHLNCVAAAQRELEEAKKEYEKQNQ